MRGFVPSARAKKRAKASILRSHCREVGLVQQTNHCLLGGIFGIGWGKSDSAKESVNSRTVTLAELFQCFARAFARPAHQRPTGILKRSMRLGKRRWRCGACG